MRDTNNEATAGIALVLFACGAACAAAFAEGVAATLLAALAALAPIAWVFVRSSPRSITRSELAVASATGGSAGAPRPMFVATRNATRHMSALAHACPTTSMLDAGDTRPTRNALADAFVSLNGKPRRRLIDPAVDLARETDGLGDKPWILR